MNLDNIFLNTENRFKAIESENNWIFSGRTFLNILRSSIRGGSIGFTIGYFISGDIETGYQGAEIGWVLDNLQNVWRTISLIENYKLDKKKYFEIKNKYRKLKLIK